MYQKNPLFGYLCINKINCLTDTHKKTTKMTTGIIVAMEKELRLLTPSLYMPQITEEKGFTFYSGTIGSRKVCIMKCGIGKVNAAVGTAAMIDTFHPHLIINTGVAGGTGAAGILDVVLADRIAYHDIWCGPGTEEGDAAGCPRFFTPPAAVLRLPCATARGIKHGLVCSGDRFISTPAEVKHILGLYPDALAVDMESAAIAHVCHLRNVPFVCLRVISDTPGAADNIAQYENFWEDAPRHTFEALSALLAELPEQSEL